MNNTTTSPFRLFLRIFCMNSILLWSRWSLRRLSCLPPQLHASDCCLCPVTEVTPKKGRCFMWLKSAAKMASRNTFSRHVFKKKSWPDMTGHRIHIRFCIVIVPHDVSSYIKQLPKGQPPFPTKTSPLAHSSIGLVSHRNPEWIFSHVHHLELETLRHIFLNKDSPW